MHGLEWTSSWYLSICSWVDNIFKCVIASKWLFDVFRTVVTEWTVLEKKPNTRYDLRTINGVLWCKQLKFTLPSIYITITLSYMCDVSSYKKGNTEAEKNCLLSPQPQNLQVRYFSSMCDSKWCVGQIWIPYTPCERFKKHLAQGESNFQVDKLVWNL